MKVHLHKNARTTPLVRQEIQASSLSERALASKYGISRTTARKWKQRDSTGDASHRPNTLHTTLTPAQEAIVVYLRKALLLPLIAEVLNTHCFDSTEDLETTLHYYAELYNHHIPQLALGPITPLQALINWQLSHPQLFRKKVYKQPELDI